ncbi:hypothetical protein ACPFUC_001930 [Vibrio cholerae]|nr:hypothetical protein [Vibrio cholerae]
MYYLTIFMINVLGSYFVSYLEQIKGIKKKKKNRLMGEWPYNITILGGVLGLIVGEHLNEEILLFGVVMVSTISVYLFIIRNLLVS